MYPRLHHRTSRTSKGVLMPIPDSTVGAVGDLIRLTPAAAVRAADAAAVLQAGFGLAGRLDRLPGEVDNNFLLTTADGERYVVKFAHPKADPDFTDLQARVLRHLQAVAGGLPVQRVVPATDGRLWITAGPGAGTARGRIVLVTSYLSGTPLRAVKTSAALRRELGDTLAVLARALSELDRPSGVLDGSPAGRPLLWDIAQLPRLRPLAAELPADAGRDLLTDLIDRFAAGTEPRLATLRTQLVHNDFNPDNILISADGSATEGGATEGGATEGGATEGGTVAGILDFGDMTVTALANDVAIAASYQLSDETDPVGPALDLIGGYHARNPLTAAELDLLPELILARLVASVAIARWRAIQFPHNQAYILRSTPMSWARLNRLLAIPAGQLAERIHAVCPLEKRHA
jgi:hydroxylysine kinase